MGLDASENENLHHYIAVNHAPWSWPSRKYFSGHNRSSFSSLSSHDSGLGGGKIKHSRELGTKRQITTSARESPHTHSSCVSLRPSCKSVPVIRTTRAILSSRSIDKSNRNEVWNYTTRKKKPSKLISTNDPKPKKLSFAKGSSLKPTGKKKRHVAFANTPGLIPHDFAKPLTSQWYEKTDYNLFLDNTVIRAQITKRTMKYASINERTYNSSIGLTSPQVLKEYLSSPEEVIGTEHFLAGQGFARTSLRCHHTKVLLEEQCRQEREGSDPDLLAKRLRDTSSISTHLARERAAYINLLD